MFIRLKRTLLATTLFAASSFFACTDNANLNVTEEEKVEAIDLKSVPYPSLSDYGFFKGELNELEPKVGVMPFDLATPLFSDYAHKKRFVVVPDGQKVEYNSKESFDFPKGSVLVKNFYYINDETDPSSDNRIIETRLLIHEEEGWMSYAYAWNEEQTDAALSLVGGQRDVEFTNKEGELVNVNYMIPNQNDCNSCHNISGVFTPIGPKARHLNTNFEYKEGVKNQLQKWEDEGLISLPDVSQIPEAVVWTDESYSLDARAKSYLDINCGHCHRPEGTANNSGLFLYGLEEDPSALGLCKKPVAAGKGSGGLLYDIVPGTAEESILHFRLNSAQPDIMMPELGRTLVHKEGVKLIKDWIDSMPEKACK